MEAPARVCTQTTVHPPHWWMMSPAMALVSCPGIDGDPLPADDSTPEFDWSPEHLYLSDAAAFLVRLHRNEDNATTGRAQYLIGMELWMQLTGLHEPEALTFAYQICSVQPPVMGTVIPF